jgi:hypothetical protein
MAIDSKRMEVYTSVDGLLVPGSIIRLIVSVSALAWLISIYFFIEIYSS